jgi:hypothetical protein
MLDKPYNTINQIINPFEIWTGGRAEYDCIIDSQSVHGISLDDDKQILPKNELNSLSRSLAIDNS